MITENTIKSALKAVMKKHKSTNNIRFAEAAFVKCTDKRCQWCHKIIPQMESFCSETCRDRNEKARKEYEMKQMEIESAKRAR